ncbi:MAG: hypothetical protein BWZ02_01259 [Lentisphaerae bacterium ADurb.BinA184]|nr:MAG: hypothetical protein BWZ02_01259 [Lentisphaerae bacterium ADurb.BinA184]
MGETLHITSGDCAGGSLSRSGLPGEVFVWHDILYDGPRNPGWPDEATLAARAKFIEAATGGGLRREPILRTLRAQYRKLAEAAAYARIVLWFDACLFDQAMLAHVLTCLALKGIRRGDLLCVDAFPGIEPYHGLGQLLPAQMASLYGHRHPVTDAQFAYAATVDQAFATQDTALFSRLAAGDNPPLPWVPAAVRRWLDERPHPETGLGRLESLALNAVRDGHQTPGAIFAAVAVADTPPQYWGDTTLWAKINSLADREPPLVRIAGPAARLPQWESPLDLKAFRITAVAM